MNSTITDEPGQPLESSKAGAYPLEALLEAAKFIEDWKKVAPWEEVTSYKEATQNAEESKLRALLEAAKFIGSWKEFKSYKEVTAHTEVVPYKEVPPYKEVTQNVDESEEVSLDSTAQDEFESLGQILSPPKLSSDMLYATQWLIDTDNENDSRDSLSQSTTQNTQSQTIILSSPCKHIYMHVDESCRASVHSMTDPARSKDREVGPGFSSPIVHPIVDAEWILANNSMNEGNASEHQEDSPDHFLSLPNCYNALSHDEVVSDEDCSQETTLICDNDMSDYDIGNRSEPNEDINLRNWEMAANSTCLKDPSGNILSLSSPKLAASEFQASVSNLPSSPQQPATESHEAPAFLSSQDTSFRVPFELSTSDIHSDINVPLEVAPILDANPRRTDLEYGQITSKEQMKKIMKRSVIRNRVILDKQGDIQTSWKPICRETGLVHGLYDTLISALHSFQLSFEIPEFPIRRVKCSPYCEATLGSWHEFAEHLDLAHGPLLRRFECPCKTCIWSIFGFFTMTECRRHIKRVHLVSPFSCELCQVCGEERYFSRQDGLRRHLKNFHYGPTKKAVAEPLPQIETKMREFCS